MKILHLSAASELTGAGKATLLTHYALLEQGIESKVLFLKSDIVACEVYSFHNSNIFSKISRLLITTLDRIPPLFYPKRSGLIFSPGLIGLKLKNNKFLKWADIIHIHWANHGFIDTREIQKWNKPVVWTLRDMWAFTGGCHHTFDCTNFINECSKCPALISYKKADLSRFVFRKKIKYLKGANINWIAISTWIQNRANESTILRSKSIDIIPSGVDTELFTLFSKTEVRSKLKLSLDKTILLLGAADITEKYKGFEYSKSLLNKISPEYLVITFGSGYFIEGEIPQQSIHFGPIDNQQLCALYNAADVFIGPSIAEAMGKTFLEAQLCGTPVLCFEETGPADIVKHKETGYLAKFKDNDDLLVGLEFCLNTKMDRELIRSKAVEQFDIKTVAKEYIKVYEKSIVDWAVGSSIRSK